jgi:Lrp/AsnC family leucine-responsive transcriptional regulator
MPTKTPSPFPLDDLDRRILNVLQTDCSATNQDLARQVHASAPTCLRRVRRLVENGVIQRQVAIVDPDRTGSSLTALIEITLDVQTEEYFEQFEAAMASEDAVLQCYRVSPGPDFVVVAQVPDMPAYHAMAHRVFTSQKNVRNVRTFFSIHRSKFETRMPLSAMAFSASRPGQPRST